MASSIPAILVSDADPFPDPHLALSDPNGLLAIGGKLTPERVLDAYRHGIFPWYEDDQPVLWWSPDPRAILEFHALKISRSLRKRLQKKDYQVTVNQAFSAVIKACAEPRPGREHTWITSNMQQVYETLHQQGHALSIEVWQGEALIGGLYGVQVGRIFSGESMFSRQRDASKIALVHLCDHCANAGFVCIDCQLPNPHLESMGASLISRQEFLKLLAVVS